MSCATRRAGLRGRGRRHDHNVDRRLSAVAEIDIPFYAGLKVGVPSLPAIVEALAEGRYDLVHLCSPGPSGAAAAVIARVMGIPILGSYHTELAAYAGLRSQDPQLELVARMAIGAFYGQCRYRNGHAAALAVEGADRHPRDELELRVLRAQAGVGGELVR